MRVHCLYSKERRRHRRMMSGITFLMKPENSDVQGGSAVENPVVSLGIVLVRIHRKLLVDLCASTQWNEVR